MSTLAALSFAAMATTVSSTSVSPTPLPPSSSTTATSNLPAGRYRLEVVVKARASVPLVGASTTTTVSLVDIADDGSASQRVCSIETKGRGYVARPLLTALEALPPQLYRFTIDGDRVRADPGPLHLGKEKPLPMEVIVTGIGRFLVDVESVGHAVLDGRRTNDGVRGTVDVKQSKQTIKRGLPITIDGDTTVDTAAFTLVRIVDERDPRDCR